MYIWRVNKLINEFRTDQVTERKQLSYLLVFLVLSYIAADPYVNSVLAYGTMNTLDILLLPLSIVIAVVGTVLCYAAAKPLSPSAGFMPRYICLGLPVMVRVIFFVFALMLLAFVINDYVFTIPFIDAYINSEETTTVDVVGVSAIELLYFVLLRGAIAKSYENA